MSNLADSQKTLYNKVVLTGLIIFAAVLSVFIVYKFTHHTIDNYSIPNDQTKIDHRLNEPSVK